jgi:hypothetical protein
MAQLNIAAISPAIPELVSALAQQFHEEPTVYNSLKTSTNKKKVGGKGYRIPSRFRPPAGITYHSEGGAFGTPVNMAFDDMYVNPTAVSLAGEVSGRTIRNIEDADSAIDGMKDLFEMYASALTDDIEKNCFGDGTGLRATVSGIASNPTFDFATSPAAAFGSTKGAVHLIVGETYDVLNAAGTTNRGTVIVASKTNTQATLTAGTATLANILATDVLVLTGAYKKAFRGFAYLIDRGTGTFQLNSRASYPELNSVVIDLAGSACTVSTFNKITNLQAARMGKKDSKSQAALMPLAQDDLLRRLGQNFKRWDGDATTYNGSFERFAYGSLNVMVCVRQDEDRIYLTDLKDVERYVEMDFGVYDLDGNTLRMKSGTNGVGSDAYTFALGLQMNIGITQPRLHALIKRADITDAATESGAFASA